MAGYIKILEVNIKHSYYPGDRCRDVYFEHNEASLGLMHKMGIISRMQDGCLSYYVEDTRRQLLTDSLIDESEELKLCTKLRTKQRHFQNFTEVFPLDDSSILYFSNAHSQSGSLSTEAKVSMADSIPLNDPRLADILLPKDRHIKPLGVIDLELDRLLPLLNNSAMEDQYLSYTIHFQSRSCIWNYFLIQKKDDFESDIYIDDEDGEISFSPARDTLLADGTKAKQISTVQSLLLKERSPYRFQLLSKTSGSDKVELKNLPLPSIELLQETKGPENRKYTTSIFIYY